MVRIRPKNKLQRFRLLLRLDSIFLSLDFIGVGEYYEAQAAPVHEELVEQGPDHVGRHGGLAGDVYCRGHHGSRAVELSHIMLLEYLIICWETTVCVREECLRCVVHGANTLSLVCSRKTTSGSMLSSLLFMK